MYVLCVYVIVCICVMCVCVMCASVCVCVHACLCACIHVRHGYVMCISAYAFVMGNWSGVTSIMVDEVQVRLPMTSSISHAHSSCETLVLSQEYWLYCTD